MAVPNKTIFIPPQLISYEDAHYYLQINPSGCVLYNEHSYSPIYQLNEPLLLIQGMAASTQQVHLVMIKSNGDLCYSLVNGPGQNQTTVLAKLDVRTTRYRRLMLFPLGKTIHIFYAYAHQAIPDLWRIEHRFWNGKTWRSVNLGEVVNSRVPLYDIVLDRGGNLHLVMMTFQGRQTLVLNNRFNGSFYLWGNSEQAFQLQQEIIEITSIMTPDNIHHLFWLSKTPDGKLELGWAYRAGAQELSGNWLKAPAALQTLKGPVKGLGAIEINGGLWLLVNAEVETLLLYRGDGWKQVLSNTPTHHPLRYVRKNNSSYYNTYWLEENRDSRTPAYHQYLGLNIASSQPEQVSHSPNITTTNIQFPLGYTQPIPTYTQTPAYAQSLCNTQTPANTHPLPTYIQSATRTSPQTSPALISQPINQSAYNNVQSPLDITILAPPLHTQTYTKNHLPPIQPTQISQSELVQPKLNIETSMGESTPTKAENVDPLPLVEVGVSRLDQTTLLEVPVQNISDTQQPSPNISQIESVIQPPMDNTIQYAYDNYPDDLIPPAPESFFTPKLSHQPAHIDQPVFATQPSINIQTEPLIPLYEATEEVLLSKTSLADSILEDNTPGGISLEQEPLKENPKCLTLTNKETESNVPTGKINHESGIITLPNGTGAILETLIDRSPQLESTALSVEAPTAEALEQTDINPLHSESNSPSTNSNKKKSKSRTLTPKKNRKLLPSSLDLNTGSTAMSDSLPVFASKRFSILNQHQDTEKFGQAMAPIISKTLDPILKTIGELGSQVNLLQNENDMAWQNIKQELSNLEEERKKTFQKIEDYLKRVESEKESTLEKFEQQVNILQEEEKTNYQKIEQLISNIQNEAKKEKGFWTKWFK